MSNQRFIELSSSYRNRNIYPNPSEFEVSFVSPTVLSNRETIRGIYNINNKIFSSSNNSADTVIKGTIDYLFGNVFDTLSSTSPHHLTNGSCNSTFAPELIKSR